MIHPHLRYGIPIWGKSCNKILNE